MWHGYKLVINRQHASSMTRTVKQEYDSPDLHTYNRSCTLIHILLLFVFSAVTLGHRLTQCYLQVDSSWLPPQKSKLKTLQTQLSSIKFARIRYEMWKNLVEYSYNKVFTVRRCFNYRWGNNPCPFMWACAIHFVLKIYMSLKKCVNFAPQIKS